MGVYGVISYAVSQRSQELGMRVALGAASDDILAMVVRQGLRLTAAGALVGLLAAIALGPVIESELFGTSARDPLILATVPIVLLLVASLASYLPARRAARVDPMVALRMQ